MAWELSLDDVARALEAELSLALIDGAHDAAKLVAEEARLRHPYADRTGGLSDSIWADAAKLRSSGVVSVNVVATKRYASFVNDGTKNKDGSQRNMPYPFLAPALDRRMSGVVATLEVALVRAAEKALR